jgi:hypothetical protein
MIFMALLWHFITGDRLYDIYDFLLRKSFVMQQKATALVLILTTMTFWKHITS